MNDVADCSLPAKASRSTVLHHRSTQAPQHREVQPVQEQSMMVVLPPCSRSYNAALKTTIKTHARYRIWKLHLSKRLVLEYVVADSRSLADIPISMPQTRPHPRPSGKGSELHHDVQSACQQNLKSEGALAVERTLHRTLLRHSVESLIPRASSSVPQTLLDGSTTRRNSNLEGMYNEQKEAMELVAEKHPSSLQALKSKTETQ